ncbi:MAG TPA: helicase HerA-like domain-containing protein, partial [Flavipsychrobacter sp.]
EKGIPTPLAATMMCPPQSRMDILSEQEIDTLVRKSVLAPKYNRTIDSRSAHEILSEKIEAAKAAEPEIKERRAKEEKSVIEEIGDNTIVRSMLRTAGNMLVRSLLGSLGVSSSTRRKRRY